MKVKVFRQIFTTKNSKEPYRKASGMKPRLPTRRYNQQPEPDGSDGRPSYLPGLKELAEHSCANYDRDPRNQDQQCTWGEEHVG